MNPVKLLAHFERLSDAPDAVLRLRRFVLDLAVRGKLVSQNSRDEPASELLKRIAKEKMRIVNAGDARSPKPIPTLSVIPFSIPTSWQWSQIAEIGLLSPRNEAPDTAKTSFVPMPLIPAEYGVPHQHEIRVWGEIKKGYTHFADGDVGLAKITPCFENGKSTIFRNLTGAIGSGTTELHIVRPLFVDPEFILLFFKSPYFIETGIPKMTGTAGQKRVPTEYFAHSAFPLPPLAEQRRIVARVDDLMSLCDRLEAGRAERERRRDRLGAASLAKLNASDVESFRQNARFMLEALTALTTRPDQVKQLRQTILNLAMRGRLVAQNTKDEPVSKLLEVVANEVSAYSKSNRLVKSNIEPLFAEALPFTIPSGWQRVRLCSLFRVITDGDHQPPPRAEEGVAFLTIGNVTTGRLDFSGCRLVSEAYFRSLAPYRTPKKGDILYTVVGATYGRPAVVDTDREFCVQRHIAILKPAPSMNLRFLVWLLTSPLVYDQASKSTTGSAQPTLALRPLRNFIVPVPPRAEQDRIVAQLDRLMGLCDRLEASLRSGEARRSALLGAILNEALQPAVERDQAA